MTYKDIQAKRPEDLQKLLAEKREELRELRFKVAANQLKQVHKVREVREDIARIQTRLTELKIQGV